MCDDFEMWRTFLMGVSRRDSPFGRTAMVLALDDSVFYLLGVVGATIIMVGLCPSLGAHQEKIPMFMSG